MLRLLLVSQTNTTLNRTSAAIESPNVNEALVADRENVAIHVGRVVQLPDALEVSAELANLLLFLKGNETDELVERRSSNQKWSLNFANVHDDVGVNTGSSTSVGSVFMNEEAVPKVLFRLCIEWFFAELRQKLLAIETVGLADLLDLLSVTLTALRLVLFSIFYLKT